MSLHSSAGRLSSHSLVTHLCQGTVPHALQTSRPTTGKTKRWSFLTGDVLQVAKHTCSTVAEPLGGARAVTAKATTHRMTTGLIQSLFSELWLPVCPSLSEVVSLHIGKTATGISQPKKKDGGRGTGSSYHLPAFLFFVRVLHLSVHYAGDTEQGRTLESLIFWQTTSTLWKSWKQTNHWQLALELVVMF